jgi:hypothetical protein
MKLQILHVTDCPNVAVLAARLDEVLAGRSDVELVRRVVADQDEAVAVGMTGSPTLLVDGTDRSRFRARRRVCRAACISMRAARQRARRRWRNCAPSWPGNARRQRRVTD